jgi:hypothetical protein
MAVFGQFSASFLQHDRRLMSLLTPLQISTGSPREMLHDNLIPAANLLPVLSHLSCRPLNPSGWSEPSASATIDYRPVIATKQNGNVINGENRSLVHLFSGDRYKSAYRQISYGRLGAIAMYVGEQLLATKSFGGAANKPRRD